MLSTNAPSTAEPNNRPVAASEEVVSERRHREVAEPTDHTGVDQAGDHREQAHEEHQRRPLHLREYFSDIDFGDQQHGARAEQGDDRGRDMKHRVQTESDDDECQDGQRPQ